MLHFVAFYLTGKPSLRKGSLSPGDLFIVKKAECLTPHPASALSSKTAQRTHHISGAGDLQQALKGMGDWRGKTVKCKCLLVSLLNEGSSGPKLALIPFRDPTVYEGLAHRRCSVTACWNEFRIRVFS